MKIVINKCFGGFGLNDRAYDRLIELGVPVRAYIEQKQDPTTGLYLPESRNEGEVIFDRMLTPEHPFSDALHVRVMGRYWETWLRQSRTHPLLIQVIEELGAKAHDRLSKLVIVEIPDGVDYEIDEYDGIEHIAETHRTWS